MAEYRGVAATFICLALLGPVGFVAAAGDGSISGVGAVGIHAPARVLSVYDGDTVRVEASMWPGLTWTGSVRVEGVDTPELRGKCEGEKRKAVAARDFVREHVGRSITLMNVKKGKYAGRVVARIRLADGSDLTELLIRARHGRPYDGGRRKGWCDKEG